MLRDVSAFQRPKVLKETNKYWKLKLYIFLIFFFLYFFNFVFNCLPVCPTWGFTISTIKFKDDTVILLSAVVIFVDSKHCYSSLYHLFSFREYMTFHSSYCTNANGVPYVGRISAIAKANVDFIYQFVEHNKNNFKWGGYYLTGTPTKFPNYGDFPRTFSMVCVFPSIIHEYLVKNNRNFILQDFNIFYFSIQRNYGTDISISPWQNEAQIDEIKFKHNYIGIKHLNCYIRYC